MPGTRERNEYGGPLHTGEAGSTDDRVRSETADDLAHLGQERFGNRGRFYGGYRNEADDRAPRGRDSRGPLADKIEPTIPEDVMPSFFDFQVRSIEGAPDLLGGLKGKVVLAVNVASECGFTPQYADLEGLHEELSGEGFSVVGFPCNQFGGQEPGTGQEIQSFCSSTYGVTFPLSEKLEVNGPGRHPLYAWLTDPANDHPGDMEWNFEKFLIGRDGRLLNRYAPAVAPRDAGLMNDIAAAL